MLVLPTLQSQHGDAGGYPVHTVLSLAEKHKDRQATLNSRPFLVPHSNTQQHKNSFIVPTMTDWNHLSDDQAKAPVLEDFKWLITTITSVCTLPSHHITKGRSCDIQDQEQMTPAGRWCPWAVQARLLTPLTFALRRLSPLATFTSGAYFCKFYTANFKDIFGGP